MKSVVILFIPFLPLFAFGQEAVQSSEQEGVNLSGQFENAIGYKKGILRKRLDYKLSSNDQGKFVIEFLTKPNKPLNVKIYDVIGNLIQNDQLNDDASNHQEYDFTERKTRIFVVKIESGTDNVIKKVNT